MFRSIAILSLLLSAPAVAQNFPVANGHPVIDAANIIPADKELALNLKLTQFHKDTKGEFAVVTVSSLEGNDINSYANNLFNKLGIGNRDLNNGILLLVAPNDRKVRIEVAGSAQYRLTDGYASLIIRQKIIPAFKSGDFVGGVESGVDEVISVATPPTAEQLADNKRIEEAAALRRSQNMDMLGNWTFGLLIMAALGGLLKLFIVNPMLRRKEREEAARRAVERAEKERQSELARQRWAEQEAERNKEEQCRLARERETERLRQQREEAERKRIIAAREAKLKAMSPAQRMAFLADEERERRRVAAIAAENARLAELARVERQRREAVEQAARDDADRTRRANEEAQRAKRKREQDEEDERNSRYDSSPSWSSGSSDRSSSSSSGFDFGGGSSDGGGASGDW